MLNQFGTDRHVWSQKYDRGSKVFRVLTVVTDYRGCLCRSTNLVTRADKAQNRRPRTGIIKKKNTNKDGTKS